MPVSFPAAERPSAADRRRQHLWKFVAAIAVTAMLLPASAGLPAATIRAAGSCTGWGSTSVPPDTIRVGRSNGTVATVNFRRYVGVVMAKEWPSWMPIAALQAGATAVKQYGWFYTLAGRHRSSYVTDGGECFDVRDSTVDQLYKPEQVTVSDKIWRAVDATLGLSVRKSGKFFLTGYRAGSSSVCASDVDGSRLYAKSVIACAEKGWSREQIQRAYYAPDVTFHWATTDVAPPVSVDVAISAPKAKLRTGRTLGQKHVRVSWDEAGARPAGTTYQLQRLVNGSWSTVFIEDPTQSSLALALKWGQTHRFRVRLRTSDGDVGPWYAGPRFESRLAQDRSAAFSWSAGWKRVSREAASGGTVTHSSRIDARMTYSFTGRSVALVGTLGPTRGKARIYVDGSLEAEVDLHADKTKWRVLVFSRHWAGSAAHTLRVEVVGTNDRPRVDIDAVLVHR